MLVLPDLQFGEKGCVNMCMGMAPVSPLSHLRGRRITYCVNPWDGLFLNLRLPDSRTIHTQVYNPNFTTYRANKKVMLGPTEAPTMAPTEQPSQQPTTAPTGTPTTAPTVQPTESPTTTPTTAPTTAPTDTPTTAPTVQPTAVPTRIPTREPTLSPTGVPTMVPTALPTTAPSPPPGVAFSVVSPTISVTTVAGASTYSPYTGSNAAVDVQYGSSYWVASAGFVAPVAGYYHLTTMAVVTPADSPVYYTIRRSVVGSPTTYNEVTPRLRPWLNTPTISSTSQPVIVLSLELYCSAGQRIALMTNGAVTIRRQQYSGYFFGTTATVVGAAVSMSSSYQPCPSGTDLFSCGTYTMDWGSGMGVSGYTAPE